MGAFHSAFAQPMGPDNHVVAVHSLQQTALPLPADYPSV